MYILKLMRMILICAILVFAVCIAVRLFIFLRKFKGLKIAHKSKARGIIFGRIWFTKYVLYSPCEKEGHTYINGGSGIGKTSSILIPTLRSWTDGAFVIDISGDISSNVECPCKLIYDPESDNTALYNIFAQVDRLESADAKREALAKLALLLIPMPLGANSVTQYYIKGARKILTASLIAFYHSLDFCDICKKIIESDYRTLFNEIDRTDTYAAKYISGFYQNSETNIAGCKDEVDTAIALFAQNSRIYNSVRRAKAGEKAIEPTCLESSKIFVRIDDTDLELFAPLLAIMTAQMLQYLAKRPQEFKTTVLLALDEFASLNKIEITPALRKLRKRNVRIMILTQSLADLDLIYGKDERTAMLNNLDFKVILSATDTDTQEFFSKLCGRIKATRRSTSNNGTVTDTESEEFAIEPAKLGKLHPRLLLIYPAGYLLLHKNYYFK